MKRLLLILIALTVTAGAAYLYLFSGGPSDPFEKTFANHCLGCHSLEAADGLVHGALEYGDSVAAISKSIAHGFPDSGMPGFADELGPEEIRALAIYVAERRVDRLFTDFKVDAPLAIPEGVQSSALHDFKIEVLTAELDPLPFSIQPLPDGRILVTEKMRGLRIVNTDGSVSELIGGTPRVFDDYIEAVLVWGHGWLLDVALHPDYARNGWIYLHHTRRCEDCWFVARSYNRVVRGRIRDGQWVDEEVIWDPGPEHHSIVPDIGAGGRLAFDDAGYLYISVGIKGSSNFDGVQNLEKPWGKIHRVWDDGRVPTDNPFNGMPGAYPTIWTYGHRSPQGLEFNDRTGRLWSTEMGPRGGDEINLLLPGRNYGWPLYSMGLNYDGEPVNYGEWLDITFDLNDIEQPVVDLTPAPAVSSFVFYEGERFPNWAGQALVGSLKASELYRVKFDEQDRFLESEVLLSKLARIRDVEVGFDGDVFLLLEHAEGGQIVRLAPVQTGNATAAVPVAH